MHHPTARMLIAHVLGSEGFGRQALALVQAVRLFDEHAQVPEATRQLVLDSCRALPPDPGIPYAHPINQLPVPHDEADLCQQLAPVLAAMPVDPGMALGHLWALVQIWPHVATNERADLRARLINGLGALRIEPEAHLSVFQLREWQRRVPTQFGDQRPSVSTLRGIIEAKDPLAAFCLLAEHLGMTIEMETLCWVLGSLTIHQLQIYHDRDGLLVHTLFGATACERLAKQIPIDHLITLLPQLAHRMWWLRHRGNLRPVIASMDQSQRSFQASVKIGDITVAQRAARVLSAQQPVRFWEECWQLVHEHCLRDPRDLPRILSVCDAVRGRSDDGLPSGDDAAALASLLADSSWQVQPSQVTLA